MKLPEIKLNAVKLRALLSVAILLVAGVGIGAFIYASSWLGNYVSEVQSAVAESESSNKVLSRLETTKLTLDKQADAVSRATRITVPTQQYEYQDHIITNLNEYAALSGVRITNIGFAQADSDATASGAPSGGGQPTAAPGIGSISATVDLQTPLKYTDLLRFMSYIEQSLAKMQIKNVALQKSDGGDVSVQTLTIEVYTR